MRRVLPLVAVLLLAPALAVVLITTLLLVGVNPHLVFLPGHLLRSALAAFGVHVHNRVGVLSTDVFWWGMILLVWLALRRRLRRGSHENEWHGVLEGQEDDGK